MQIPPGFEPPAMRVTRDIIAKQRSSLPGFVRGGATPARMFRAGAREPPSSAASRYMPAREGQPGALPDRVEHFTQAGMCILIRAVRCAVEVQRRMAEANAANAPEKFIEFRVGINFGDVIVAEDDIFGDRVNVAATTACLGGFKLVTAGVRLDTADAARFSAPAPSAYRLERLPGTWNAICCCQTPARA